ncbi:hypothetical protein SRB5_10390 [Streptomyces sp. RB5]|uniref:Sulfotransferase n=1 Tax=Streptomyces smaragdinus TaxID=2585196 RepID=A0A7K0CBY7_9ACTN|nr:sulfotransferase [Streptomyces smaragdinus]MQY10926.1 hypothetical protein [Streptomyces smaragdinus]
MNGAVAWTVTGRAALPPDAARRAARTVHHAPFPPAPGLLARAVAPEAGGVRARYLFASAAAAADFTPEADSALRRLGPLRTETVRAVPPASLTAPVVIVSPPRSGSTALFDALARNPGLWSLGGESEGEIEGVPALHPAAGGYTSHALGADQAQVYGAAVRAGLLAGLRDAGLLTEARIACPRLLEKTPENSLRLPFLLRLFPDATIVRLHRDPLDTVASMVRAWDHPGFVNIPQLPGWPRGAWHLLLPPGWRAWAHDDLSRVAARQWSAAQEAIQEAYGLVPAHRWLDVDYAELRTAPARTIRRLETALGLPPSPHPVDLPLSATTITPPSPGKWRRTPGFDPAAVHEVLTDRRLPRKGPGAVPPPDRHTRGRPSFACWLHEAVDEAPAQDGTEFDPAAVLQTGITVPLGLARRTRFRDRFLPDHPILWTEDPGTGALAPFWVRFEDFWTLRALVPGRPLPAELPQRLRTALAAAGATGSPRTRAERAADAEARWTGAAGDFTRTDVCRIGRMIHPAQRAGLLDYYERLIATGSWPLGDAQVAGRYGWYNESLSRFFHHQFRSLVGRLAGRPVRPSYSYVSAYRGGAVLDRHVDREQCEYTVSLLLGESGPGIEDGWPLHLDTAQGTVSVVEQPGEAVLFRGTTVPHGRPPLPDRGTHTSMLFHYVPADFRRTLY